MSEGEPPIPHQKAWRWVARLAIVICVVGVAGIAFFVWKFGSLWREISETVKVDLGPAESFPETFPKVDLVAGLLEEPKVLPDLSGWSPEILASVPAGDGKFALLRGSEGSYDLLDPDLASSAKIRTEGFAFDLEVFATRKEPVAGFALLAKEHPAASAEGLAGIRPGGDSAWTWKPKDGRLKAAATLYDANGESGFVAGPGGDEGLVGLDLDGRPRWNLENRFVVYELRSNPAVPRRFLFTSGDATLFSNERDSAPKVVWTNEIREAKERRSKWESEWFNHGLLFSGSEGHARFVLAGKSHTLDAPILVAMDDADERAWAVRPSATIEALALVEPPGKPRLVVAATGAGELLVLDESGTLRARARLPTTIPKRRTAIYRLAAGRGGSDAWFVAVKLLRVTSVFRLHPEKLP